MSKRTALQVCQENQELLKQVLGLLRQQAGVPEELPGTAPADPVLPADRQPAVIPSAAPAAQVEQPAQTPQPAAPAVPAAPAPQPASPAMPAMPSAPAVMETPAAPEPASPEAAMREAIVQGLYNDMQKGDIEVFMQHNGVTDMAMVPDNQVEKFYGVLQQYLASRGTPQLAAIA